MKNVVVVVMDCARHCLVKPELTPFISSLAEKGITYENHYSTAPWTLPSHATMFTGLYTREHGTEHDNMVLPDDIKTLAEVMREKGYHTAVFSNNPWVGPSCNLDRGFDHVESIWHSYIRDLPVGVKVRQKVKKVIMKYSKYLDYRDSGAKKTNNRVFEWYGGRKDQEEPYFLFINYMELHAPFKPPEPYRSQHYTMDIPYEDLEQDFRKINGKVPEGIVNLDALRQLCNGEMAYLDSKIEELFNELDDGNTIWVITSDHGDLLGEDGWVGHRFNLHKNLLHVPLVIYDLGPKVAYNSLTSHIDFFDMVKNQNFGLPRRRYNFAEFTNPMSMLHQMGELEHFGPKFDVKRIDQDLERCFNIIDQPSSTALEDWKDSHPKRIIENDRKVSFNQIASNLRKRGYC